jgi:hypothetical protein
MPRDLFEGGSQPGAIWNQPKRDLLDPNAYWPYRLGKGVVDSFMQSAKTTGDVMSGRRTELSPGETLGMAGWGVGANPGIRAGDRALPGVGMARKEGGPSEGALFAEADKNFADFRKSPILMGGKPISEFSARLRQELDEKGFLPEDVKLTDAAVRRIENPPPNAALSTKAYHSQRMRFQGITGKKQADGSPTRDAAAASLALRRWNEFFRGLDETGIVAGTPAEIAAARKSFNEGLGNYAAGKRSQTLTKIEDKADRQSASSNSGLNLDNTLRQKINKVLDNPRGYSPEEVTAMERFIYGTKPRNAARRVSNVLGGGGGLGALAASGVGGGLAGIAGLMAGAPATASGYGAAIAAGIPPLLGAGLKSAENALASKHLRQLGDTVRARSPLAEKGPYQGAIIPSEQRTTLLRLLPLIAKSDPEAALELWRQANPNSL